MEEWAGYEKAGECRRGKRRTLDAHLQLTQLLHVFLKKDEVAHAAHGFDCKLRVALREIDLRRRRVPRPRSGGPRGVQVCLLVHRAAWCGAY